MKTGIAAEQSVAESSVCGRDSICKASEHLVSGYLAEANEQPARLVPFLPSHHNTLRELPRWHSVLQAVLSYGFENCCVIQVTGRGCAYDAEHLLHVPPPGEHDVGRGRCPRQHALHRVGIEPDRPAQMVQFDLILDPIHDMQASTVVLNLARDGPGCKH